MGKYTEILAKRIECELDKLERRPAWLAQKSGVPAASISRILKFKQVPTVETVGAIAEALGVSVGHLTDDISDPKTERQSLTALIWLIPDHYIPGALIALKEFALTAAKDIQLRPRIKK